MKTKKVSGKILGSLEFDGDLILTGDLEVEKWIDITGNIDCAGYSIKAGGYIKAGDSIEAGDGILAQLWIKCGKLESGEIKLGQLKELGLLDEKSKGKMVKIKVKDGTIITGEIIE